jgi:hypothetical protein
VDGLANTRKFFAGLAMTIMVRERAGVDFVDLKGANLNEFYMGNLDLTDNDPGAKRVIRLLDSVAELPGIWSLREGKPLSFLIKFDVRIS